MLAQAQSISDTVRDTAVVKTPPLPGGVGPYLRWLFNLPTWIQVTAAAVVALVGLTIVWAIWRRRKAIRGWFTTRSRGTKLALGGVLAAVGIAIAVMGTVSWNYMQHNNDFCVSCHVMTPAYARFQHSEHRQLSCHDCHVQSIFVSARQLVLWVAEKPQEIPPHSKVPNKVCGACHMQAPGQDSIWKRISATAGHRVHLNSDSAVLKGIQCTKCHGLSVHHFVPVDSTCGQSQCHQNLPMRIAKMRDQTDLHCTKCHQFTAGVSENISLDSSKKALGPTLSQCVQCHEMKKRLGNYDEASDPHKGVCGSCHNPHTQASPQIAWQTCQNSGCHAKPETLTPLHRGISLAALNKCESCHKAHEWKVSGDKCLVCHKNIFEDRAPGARAQAGITPARFASASGQGIGYTGSQLFSHRRHRAQECTVCHATGKAHGALLVKTVADCQVCHHASPKSTPAGAVAGAKPVLCTTCHNRTGLPQAIEDTVQVKLTVWKEPRSRVLGFRHDKHVNVDCTLCHATPVSLAVPAEKSCQSCHDKHHQPDVECRACHPTPKTAHTRDAHLGCAGSQCHAPQTVQGLAAKRNVCLVCHQTQVSHKPGKECATCHQVQWLTAQRGTQ